MAHAAGIIVDDTLCSSYQNTEQKVRVQLAAMVGDAAFNRTRPGLKSLSSDTIRIEASVAQGLLLGLHRGQK